MPTHANQVTMNGAMQAIDLEAKPKRKGRPKGSKNKPKVAKEPTEQVQAEPVIPEAPKPKRTRKKAEHKEQAVEPKQASAQSEVASIPRKSRRHEAKLTPAMIANKWKPGQSGNVYGRPKVEAAKKKAEETLDLALQTWIGALKDPACPWATKVQAASLIYERAAGKPQQHITQDITTEQRTDSDLTAQISYLIAKSTTRQITAR